MDVLSWSLLAGGKGFVEADLPSVLLSKQLEDRVVLGFPLAEEDLGLVLFDLAHGPFALLLGLGYFLIFHTAPLFRLHRQEKKRRQSPNIVCGSVGVAPYTAGAAPEMPCYEMIKQIIYISNHFSLSTIIFSILNHFKNIEK
jgi:hypothetical protein